MLKNKINERHIGVLILSLIPFSLCIVAYFSWDLAELTEQDKKTGEEVIATVEVMNKNRRYKRQGTYGEYRYYVTPASVTIKAKKINGYYEELEVSKAFFSRVKAGDIIPYQFIIGGNSRRLYLVKMFK